MQSFLAYSLLILSMLCEAPITLALFGQEPTTIIPTIFWHLVGVAFASLGFFLFAERTGPGRTRSSVWWVYALVMCTVMPLYGLLSTIVVFILQRRIKPKPPPIVSDEIKVQSAEVFARPINKSRQLEILERLDIEPFVDIFRSGHAELKKSAVKFLSTLQSQEAMKTLNRALMDEDIEVRLYAAGVIGLIDDNYTRQIDILRHQLVKAPQDEALSLELAELYLAYAESGLLDPIAQAYYFRETIRLFTEIPKDAAVLFILARAHFALSELAAAKEAIEQSLRLDPKDANTHQLYCEILFALGEFTQTADEVKRMREEKLLSAEDELATYWTAS